MKHKSISEFTYIEVNRLRGIKVLYNNDIYELAKLVLKIMDAQDKIQDTSSVTSRPTILGLANKYEYICGGGISSHRILEIIQSHGLQGNEVIDFGEKSKQQRHPTVGTVSNEIQDNQQKPRRAPRRKKQQSEVN